MRRRRGREAEGGGGQSGCPKYRKTARNNRQRQTSSGAPDSSETGEPTTSAPPDHKPPRPQTVKIPPPVRCGAKRHVEKCQRVLSGVFYDQVYPDGSSCDYDNYSSITINQFAVYDVDAGIGRMS